METVPVIPGDRHSGGDCKMVREENRNDTVEGKSTADTHESQAVCALGRDRGGYVASQEVLEAV